MAAANRAMLLQNAQSIIGYTFVDASILWEALQAAGAPRYDTNGRDFSNGNKRLALVGDAVLKLVLLDAWYGGPCDIQTGNNQVANFGSNANLTQIGRTKGLDACVHNNPSAWGVVSNGVMAQTVEAVLGAVWLDSGEDAMGAVRDVMSTLGLTAT